MYSNLMRIIEFIFLFHVYVCCRLRDNGVPVRLQFCPNLPHLFFNFSLVLPEARDAIFQVAAWAAEAVA